MKKFNAYIATDLSIHKTPEEAAKADLMALGIPAVAADAIILHRRGVFSILGDLDRAYYLPTYYEVEASE